MSRQKIFVSYSHRDRAWLERLLEHLGALERWQLVHAWTDGRIGAGASWEDEIDRALGEAKAAVLLVSPAFLASQYIWDVEMERIEAHRRTACRFTRLSSDPVPGGWRSCFATCRLARRTADRWRWVRTHKSTST
jgi:TIR domain